jgi:hypothetical protein
MNLLLPAHRLDQLARGETIELDDCAVIWTTGAMYVRLSAR